MTNSEGELNSVEVKLNARIGRKNKSLQDRIKIAKKYAALEIGNKGHIL